jgi:hypothetical protein
MSEHMDVAGDWARNSLGQGVYANDETRVNKDDIYYCWCGCRDIVTLKRSEWARLNYVAKHINERTGTVRLNETADIANMKKRGKRAHFAYKSQHRRNGCTGTNGCNETEIHYNAKWLLHDIFKQIKFWRVCDGYSVNHRVGESYEYTGGEWTATVETQIPGTNRIADVLLVNSSTGKNVALEVYHTSEVKNDKKEECEEAGVTIIEVKAIYITSDCHDLHNRLNRCTRGACGECIEEDRIRQERFKAYCARREKEEHDRREREELEREQLCKHNIAIELQNAAREADAKREEIERKEEFEEIEEIERRATEEKRRHERDANRKKAEAQAQAKAAQEIVWAAATRKRRRAEMAAAIATGDRSAMWAMGALRGPVEF